MTRNWLFKTMLPAASVAVVALFALNPGHVQAAPTTCHSSLTGTNLNNVDGSTDVSCFDAPNDNDLGANSVVNDVNKDGISGDRIFGIGEDWLRAGSTSSATIDVAGFNFGIGPSTSGIQQGLYWVSESLLDSYTNVMLFFKDGAAGANAFLISKNGFSDVAGAVTNGAGTGLFCGNVAGLSGPVAGDCAGDFTNLVTSPTGNVQDISHASIYVSGTRQNIPVPATFGLLGFGLAAMGVFASRRRKN